MKTLLTTTLLAAGLSLSTASYSAAVDFIDNGHYTTDTISGLDWLDVTQTVNMSWNDVNTQLNAGGYLEGWQFATGSQFLTMVNNFADTAFTSFTDYNYVNEGIADNLVMLLGDTYASYFKVLNQGLTPDQYYNSSPGNSRSFTLGFLKDVYDSNVPYIAWLLDHPEHDPSLRDFAKAWAGFRRADLGYLDIGSFLVRSSDYAPPSVSAVPIPAAAFLFAPALLGFLGLRHKRRA